MDCEIVCYEEVKRAAQTAFWVSGTPRANSETVRFDNNKGRSAMKKLVIAVVAALAASSAWAIAIPQTFSGTAVGEWNDPVMESSGAYVNIANNDAGGVAKVRWGIPLWWGHTRSYLQFDGAGSDPDGIPPQWDTSDSNPFVLGKLDYHNGTQWAGTGIEGVDLDLLVSILNPSLGAYSFEYGLRIDNTSNPYGDTVVILTAPAPISFTYGGWEYMFGVRGFSTDGQNFTSQLYAQEESSVCTKIWGTLRGREVQTPDGGATILLAGMALTGLAFLRSRLG
jgi:hypothetical protein